MIIEKNGYYIVYFPHLKKLFGRFKTRAAAQRKLVEVKKQLNIK